MRFKTVADVLDVVKQFHSALARQFAELEQVTTSERAQLMLDYLHRHERNLAKAIEQYFNDANESVLHAWLQYAPEVHPEELLQKVRSVDLNDVDSIVRVALEIDDYLLDLYREVAAHADTDEVKDAFESFVRVENNERHNVARGAFCLEDM
jgi:rubrerythrin